MTQRTKAVELLAAYFDEKGHILTAPEYKKQKDAPIRYARIKTIFMSWARMEKIVREFNARNASRSARNDATEVLRRRNEANAEYSEKMKAASENLEVKHAREMAVQRLREDDAMRVKTAEGAAENKMRKGGVSDEESKARAEAAQKALAEEHAMLAKTGEGSALGKHLLGGVEDLEEVTRAIEEQNAMRTKTKLLAATPEGAAEAKLMEDDTDGQLTREAQARLRNELRPYVAPVNAGVAEKAEQDATAKVREQAREAVKLAASPENVKMGADEIATLARIRAETDNIAQSDEISDEILKTMPPADQPVDEGFAEQLAKAGDTDEEGKPKRNLKVEKQNDEGSKELQGGEKEANQRNPAAPAADRNPDPKLAAPGTENVGDQKQGNPPAAKPATKPAAKKS